MPSKPVQRTLEKLRQTGTPAAVVEKWNGNARVRQDLFGFIDILALDLAGGRLVAIQTTNDANRANHRAKIMASPMLCCWLAVGGVVELWTWKKSKRMVDGRYWNVTIENITLDASAAAELAAKED